ncbi:MATE family efflux transporter [Pseudokineococcus basanitobsidens]
MTGAGASRPAAATPPRDVHVARLARGGAAGLVGAGLSALLTLAFTVLVTRTLPQQQAGLFFALTSAFLIAYSVASLGVPTGVVYFVARYRATGQAHRVPALLRHGLTWAVVAAGVTGLVGIALAPRLATLLGDGSDASTTLVRILSAALLVAVLNDVAVGITRGYDTMRPFVLVERIGRPLAQLVIALVVVALGGAGAVAVGTAWVLPFLLTSAVLLGWVRRLNRPSRAAAERAEGAPGHVDRGAFWRFTGPRGLAALSQMVLQRSDIVLLGVLAGPVPAAVYTASTRFLVFGQLGAGAISTTMQPRIAALLAAGDVPSAQRVYRVATTWLVLMAWPLYLLAAVLAPEMLLLFGQDYQGGVGVVVLLSLTMLVATGCGAVDVVLTMAGRSAWTMGNALAAVAVNVALNLLLIPRLGVFGAAMAWSAAILLRNLLPLAQLALSLRLHPFGRMTAAAAGLSLVLVGGLPAAARAISGGSSVVTAAVAVIGVLGYAAVVVRKRRAFDLHQFSAIRRRRA